MKSHRYEGNPILTPDPASDWECLVRTNQTSIGLATCKLEDLLDYLLSCPC